MGAKRRTKKPSRTKSTGKAWAGRFTAKADPRAEAYAASLDLDIRLLPYDLVASQAHVEMLGRRKIISRAEAKKIQDSLKRIMREWERNKISPRPGDEDVHMLVERRLSELIGPVAGKMHTARSRNDQVVTDLKLYLQDECRTLIDGLRAVQRSLVKQAERHVGWLMPGYTHLQTAQPVWLSHWLLAHLKAFQRDEARFEQLLTGALDELPLGAAALAGTSHPIDRRATARLLGFSRISENSLDTVGDRDFCLEFLAALALCGVHFSRLAEELVLFSSHEFGFLTCDQGFATGSSIMPQKRNPDIAELIRGRSGRLFGNLMALLTVLKGLPLAYNRDLQEDKAAVFEAADTVVHTLIVLPPLLDTLQFHRERLEQACQLGFPTATEAADHLARQGVPFREAHAAVGRAVTWAAGQKKGLEEITLEKWRYFHPAFKSGVLADVKLSQAVTSKKSWGSTAPNQVRAALGRERKRLFPGKRVNK